MVPLSTGNRLSLTGCFWISSFTVAFDNGWFGVPYSTEGMLHTEGRGGTPYLATTTAGPKGELAPIAEDLAICRVQGKRVAELAKKIRG
jgi:hypothetical protein